MNNLDVVLPKVASGTDSFMSKLATKCKYGIERRRWEISHAMTEFWLFGWGDEEVRETMIDRSRTHISYLPLSCYGLSYFGEKPAVHRSIISVFSHVIVNNTDC
jgi:hypothetical protein